MSFLHDHQIEIMIFLSGICIALALLAVFFRDIQHYRKRILVAMSVSSAWLLLSDCVGWTYLGSTSAEASFIVRFANCSVFACTLLLVQLFNLYVSDLCKSTKEIAKVPVPLKLASIAFIVGEVGIILNLFFGFYYTFDENNVYQRGDLLMLAYVSPLAIAMLDLSVITFYYKKFKRVVRLPLVLFTIVPLFASALQVIDGSVSYTDIAFVIFVIVLHMFVVVDVNMEMNEMHMREIERLYAEQKHDYELIKQTATALSGAIEAKDIYTHGHSNRVAKYAEMIARMAGEDDTFCEDIYLSGLLHDVGKIGIPETIINKPGKLTSDEYDVIKKHPVLGSHILDNVRVAPILSIGALYHHERFDGDGYPDKLSGEDIPKIARIIAVADAYDAMTSKRSYRDVLPQAAVRAEILKGKGTQFDPIYADIMLNLIDSDVNYQLRELDNA